MSYKPLLLRALVAGLMAGLLVAIYVFAVIEPTIDRAIAVEHAAEHDHGHDAKEMFSRTTQKGGGAAASIIYGVIVGAIFGTVYAAVRHRLSLANEVTRVAWLAAVGFGAVALVPAIKYPANPPGVGDPNTIGQRTTQYLALLALSIVLAIVLTHLSGWLRHRVAPSAHGALLVVTTVAAYATLLAITPGSPDTIGRGVSAQLLWDFRVRSFGGLALLWLGLGTGFGWLLERHSERTLEATPSPELAGTRA